MEVSVENTSTLGRRIKVSVPDAKVKEQYNAKLSKFAREARLKGFRPGKVPHIVIQKKFGPSLRLEVIEGMISETLKEIFKEKALHVAGAPKIEALTNESGKDLEFTATLEVYPEIILCDLHEIEYEKRIATVTEEDVNKMITKLKQNAGAWEQVDRAIEADDKIKVDFARQLQEEGAVREEEKNVELLVSGKGVLPGLTEALLGKTVGESIELATRYPEDWAEANVAGKAVTLWAGIHEIHQKNPITDEELIEKLKISKETSLLETVKERMQQELETTLREELKEKVLEILLEKNPIELPVALIEREKESMRREFSQQRKVEIPIEAMQQPEVEEQAKRRVELGLLLNEVIKKYQIKAEASQIIKEIEKIAARFPDQAQQVVELYRTNKGLLQSVERMVLLDQAVNVMLGEMKAKEIPVTFDQIMNES